MSFSATVVNRPGAGHRPGFLVTPCAPLNGGTAIPRLWQSVRLSCSSAVHRQQPGPSGKARYGQWFTRHTVHALICLPEYNRGSRACTLYIRYHSDAEPRYSRLWDRDSSICHRPIYYRYTSAYQFPSECFAEGDRPIGAGDTLRSSNVFLLTKSPR